MCAWNSKNEKSEMNRHFVRHQDSETDNDWDEYEVVDPKSGRKTEDQPFAADDDWDEYEVVDPKSGRTTEDQPFAEGDDGDEYGAGENIPGIIGSWSPLDDDSATAQSDPTNMQRSVSPLAVDNTLRSSVPPLVEEAVALRRRGGRIQTIRHKRRGDLALLYTAASGRRYIIDSNSTSNRVFEERGDRRISITIQTECSNLWELLAAVDFNDLVAASLTQEESHG
jgi:hypothetical protein